MTWYLKHLGHIRAMKISRYCKNWTLCDIMIIRYVNNTDTLHRRGSECILFYKPKFENNKIAKSLSHLHGNTVTQHIIPYLQTQRAMNHSILLKFHIVGFTIIRCVNNTGTLIVRCGGFFNHQISFLKLAVIFWSMSIPQIWIANTHVWKTSFWLEMFCG